MQLEKLASLVGFLVHDTSLRRYRYSALLSNNTDRFGKSYSVSEHHELKDISSHLAAMAVEELFVPVDCKRSCLLGMKRAKALECVPRTLKGDVIGNHPRDVGRIANGIRKVSHRTCRRLAKRSQVM